ncbi:hypothetical protein BJX62DRAFT_7299 [Aspergillus germanicus]
MSLLSIVKNLRPALICPLGTARCNTFAELLVCRLLLGLGVSLRLPDSCFKLYLTIAWFRLEPRHQWLLYTPLWTIYVGGF